MFLFIGEDTTAYWQKHAPTKADMAYAHSGFCTIYMIKGSEVLELDTSKGGVWKNVQFKKETKRLTKSDKIVVELFHKVEAPDLGRPIKKDEGLHITLKDFVSQCKQYSFVDSDGHGVYASPCRRFKKSIKPSECVAGTFDKRFTHVLWFNK